MKTGKGEGWEGGVSLSGEPTAGCVAGEEQTGEALCTVRLAKEQEPDQGGPCHSWEGDWISFFKCKGKPFEGSKQRSDMN